MNAHARKSADAKVSAIEPVAISRDAANDGHPHVEPIVPQVITLDMLVAQQEAPSPFAVRMSFAGYDPAAGLAQGQKVASERILHAVPVFAQAVVAMWSTMSPARRELVVGFTPTMLAVLLSETVTLRGFNARYDHAAKVDSRSRARCETLASDALDEARLRRDQSVRMMRLHVSVAQQKEISLDDADEAAGTPEALALTTVAVADAMGQWRDGLPADERAYYASMGFNDALVASLRTCASNVRSTQAELDAVTNPNPVTQRQLDEQDGRVLHLVGAIHLAFRLAARRDPGIVVPALDELKNIFVHGKRSPAKVEAPPPASQPA